MITHILSLFIWCEYKNWPSYFIFGRDPNPDLFSRIVHWSYVK